MTEHARWPQVAYRKDTGEAHLSVTTDATTVSYRIEKREILILLETAAAALKKMEEN